MQQIATNPTEVPELANLVALAEGTDPDCAFADFQGLQTAFNACLDTDVMCRVLTREWLRGKEAGRNTTEERHVLWQKGDCGLVVKYLRPAKDQPELLFETPGHRMLGLITARQATTTDSLDLVVARHRDALQPDEFDPNADISDATVHRLGPGTSIALEGYWDFYAHLPTSQPQLYLLLIWQPKHRYRWDVAVDTLRPARIVCVDEDALRTASVASLLGKLPAPGNADSLGRLVKHPDHNVRWEATRALFALDGTRALAVLRQLAENDPHPHLRRTAELALQRLTNA